MSRTLLEFIFDQTINNYEGIVNKEWYLSFCYNVILTHSATDSVVSVSFWSFCIHLSQGQWDDTIMRKKNKHCLVEETFHKTCDGISTKTAKECSFLAEHYLTDSIIRGKT